MDVIFIILAIFITGYCLSRDSGANIAFIGLITFTSIAGILKYFL